MSFASEKNGAVRSVQFVISIPAIEIEEEQAAAQEGAENQSLADKLLRLFR